MSQTRKQVVIGTAVEGPRDPPSTGPAPRVLVSALAKYEDPLRQYLSIRAGRAGGSALFDDLKRQVEELKSVVNEIDPGPRAELFRLARRSVMPRLQQHRREELSWFAPAGRGASYQEAIRRLRGTLSVEDWELLELRYSRELSPQELSYVLELPIDEVVTQLESAAARASEVVGPSIAEVSGGLRVALQEALALAPVKGLGRRAPARAPVPLAQGVVIGGRYEIERRVGDGAFGYVYRARDREVPGHVVAVKLLHDPATTEEDRRAALRELNLIASVFHPSVVLFKDHGWQDDRLWFVMPWYDGETLEERMLRAPLSPKEAFEIFVPLAEALAAMHYAGVRHQDIKPGNIFLTRIHDGGVQRLFPILLDLGAAAHEREPVIAGTPLYFAPEVAARYAAKPTKQRVTGKADVFSLALSLRNALEPSTREVVSDEHLERFIAYRAVYLPSPPRAKELQFLVPSFECWMAHDPNKRPTAAEFAQQLRVLLRPKGGIARQALTRWAVLVVAACVVAAGSTAYLRAQRDAASARAQVVYVRSQLNAKTTDSGASEKCESRAPDADRAAWGELAEQVWQQQKRSRRLRDALRGARGETERLMSELGEVRGEVFSLRSRLEEKSHEGADGERLEELRRRLENAEDKAETIQRTLQTVEDAGVHREQLVMPPASPTEAATAQASDLDLFGDPELQTTVGRLLNAGGSVESPTKSAR